MAGILRRLLGGKAAPSSAGQSYVRNIDNEHLISILSNSSKHSALIYDWLRQEYLDEPAQGRSQRKRVLTGMLRYAATLRDSLDQVAKLVAGEDLGEPAERSFPLDSPNVGTPLEVLDSVVEGASVHSNEPLETEDVVSTHIAPLRPAEEIVYEPEIEPLEPISMRQVREAHIYQMVKTLQQRVGTGGWMVEDLQEILNYIKE